MHPTKSHRVQNINCSVLVGILTKNHKCLVAGDDIAAFKNAFILPLLPLKLY